MVLSVAEPAARKDSARKAGNAAEKSDELGRGKGEFRLLGQERCNTCHYTRLPSLNRVYTPRELLS